MFDWGDYSNSNWIKTSSDSNKVYASHNWLEEGVYEIKVKTKDIFGCESNWSNPIEVSMPKTKSININPGLSRLFQRFPILEFLL